MALLNRFSKLNDRAETGIFTFIVTKSVTRDFHRDATTKDFCYGYHRWAISFQRPSEKALGVHLLLRNPAPNTACVVDFTLTLLNRRHFSQNKVYSKRQAKFTITNPMQGVSRWIQMSELIERRFSDETGEFLFELSLRNMTTIFECDIQLQPATLARYKAMLTGTEVHMGRLQQRGALNSQPHGKLVPSATGNGKQQQQQQASNGDTINLETNYFTFGSFDWSLTIVPLVIPSLQQQLARQQKNLAPPSQQNSGSSLSISSLAGSGQPAAPAPHQLEPVCRVYLNRQSGFNSLCRVKYRVILGHHQAGGQQSAEFVDSSLLDQISDTDGRIRGHQFKRTNILKLISLRSGPAAHKKGPHLSLGGQPQQSASLLPDLRVHIEMLCANTVSEALVPIERPPGDGQQQQLSNCQDRNKQAWCVEADTSEDEYLRLKLFFLDLHTVPRNHIRYISWIAYVVRRDPKSGAQRDSSQVLNSPHSNYYLKDGMDMGIIMDTDVAVRELNETYLNSNHLTVHIEWVDSLLLFSHLYNNYDSLATVQRHQIRRELSALQLEYVQLERKYGHSRRLINKMLASGAKRPPELELDDQLDLDELDGLESSEEAGKVELESSLEDNLSDSQHLDELEDSYLRQSAEQVSMNGRQVGRASSLQLAMCPSALEGRSMARGKPTPMGQDERLQLSSSTPPAPLSRHIGDTPPRTRELPLQLSAFLRQRPFKLDGQQQQMERLDSMGGPIRDSSPHLLPQVAQCRSFGPTSFDTNTPQPTTATTTNARPMNILPASSQLRNQLETHPTTTTNELLRQPLHNLQRRPHHLPHQPANRFHYDQPTISGARSSVMEASNWSGANSGLSAGADHLNLAASNGNQQLHLANQHQFVAEQMLASYEQMAPWQLEPARRGRPTHPGQFAGHL